MFLKKLSSSENFFLPLIINLLLFGGIFALGMFRMTTGLIQLILVTAVFLEIIYLTILIQMSDNRNIKGLNEVKKHIEELREGEEKTYNGLIYTGHQMKAMQHELNALKRSSILKPNGNHLSKLRV